MLYFPSVTEVLGFFSDFSRVKPDALKVAQERGTAVHTACTDYLLKTPVTFEPEYKGYFDSFLQWVDQVETVVAVEQRLVHENIGYHGQLDILAILKDGHGKLDVIDLKSPVSKAKTWPLQCVAYQRLVMLHYDGIREIGRAGSLRLSQSGGTPKLDWYVTNEYERTKHFNVFMSALSLFRYLNGV